MGMLKNYAQMIATSPNQRKRIPHKVFHSVNFRENLLICGGFSGSVAEDKSLRLIEKRVAVLTKQKLSGVILSSNQAFAESLYDIHQKTIIYFGKNASYDPFKTLKKQEHCLQILQEMLSKFCNLNRFQGKFQPLVVFCRAIVTLFFVMSERYPISFKSFSALMQKLSDSENPSDFLKRLNMKEQDIPVSTWQTLQNLWNDSKKIFCLFGKAVDDSFQPYQPKLEDEHIFNVRTLLKNKKQVLVFTDTGSELVLSAIYAELYRLCRNEAQFAFLNVNVFVPKDFAKLLFRSETKTPFCMYFFKLRNYLTFYENLPEKLDTLVSVGVSSYKEAERIVLLSKELFSGDWEKRNLHPVLLMQGRRGIPDGGACIVQGKRILCCAWMGA